MKKIDVIIPAYNAHSTLHRCLSSIACQNIVDDVLVTIVDDASDTPYDDIVKDYTSHLNIQILRYDENRGPGYARNYGREHTNNPLITFIDADDTFYGTFALHFLRKALESDPLSHCCFGMFCEEQKHPEKDLERYLPHKMDCVWVFGKLYSRSFLDEHKIYMNDTRSNEDTGFNALIRMCSDPQHQIKFIDELVYVWHSTENSITRINDCDYSFNASFGGYTTNMIWAIKEAKKRFPFREHINYFIVEVLCNLYYYFIETVAHKPVYIKQNWDWCVKYYNELYKPLENLITPEIFSTNFNQSARNFYLSGRNNGFIPIISVQQFLELLKKDSEVALQSIMDNAQLTAVAPLEFCGESTTKFIDTTNTTNNVSNPTA